MSPPPRRFCDHPDVMTLLRGAPMEVLGRMPWSSNGTYLVALGDAVDQDRAAASASGGAAVDEHEDDVHEDDVHEDGEHVDDYDDDEYDDYDDDDAYEDGADSSDDDALARDPRTKAIYKPYRGERPLWDFPSGLYKREAAAYELSRALGWHVVPPTIVREGPLGEGSVQLFVDAEFAQHYFTLQEDRRYRADLEAICVFDLIANNTDRKSGHCLLGKDGRIYGIDNGLSFHVEDKLRTVLWDYAGDAIPAALLDDLRRLFDEGLPPALTSLLDADEVEACLERLFGVLDAGVFPYDRSGRRYPWPLV